VDRQKYLHFLKDVKAKSPFKLHAYCLMTNHIHLLLETLDNPLNQIMKILNQRYAIYFNHRYDYTGHVFQGGYGAKIIDSINYFLKASRYIHLNLLEAIMVSPA